MEQNPLLSTIGQRLTKAREQKKWTVDDVAKALNIPPTTIRALEQNDFDVIPQTAFLKGYLRSYAHLLDVDADQIIHQLNEERGDDTPTYRNTKSYSASRPIKMSVRTDVPTRRKGNFVFFTILLLLFGGLMVWAYPLARAWLNPVSGSTAAATPISWSQKLLHTIPFFNTHTEASQKKDNTAETTATKEVKADIKDASEKEKKVPEAIVEVNKPIEVKKVNLFTPENGGYAEPTLDKLHIEFSGPAQVTIKDAEGQTLYTGKKQPDAPLNLQGIAPFSIKIKGTPNVNLQLNDQLVDLNLYSVNGKADFRLSH